MNNRILTLLLTIFVIITLMGVASSLSRLGPNAGFSNPGDVSIGGSMTIGGNLAVGGSTVDTGVINTNTNMGIGYDLGCLTGDSIVDFHLGTGLFKTTTGAITIGGGTNGISLNGPVTGASAKSWTMAGASTLTVGSTGVTAVGGTVNFIVPVSGTDGAFSGEVTGENIASTDDARIADKLHVLGTLGVAGTATLNAIVSNTTISAEDLASSDDARIADKLHVLGTLGAAGTATLNAVVSNGSITTATGEVSAESLASTDDARIADDLYVLGTLGVADIATLNAIVSNTTIIAEDLASSDDARIADKLHVLGTLGAAGTATLNALVVNTTSTFNGGPTVASGQILAVTTADKLTVGGIVVPQEIPITFHYSATSVDTHIFTATGAYQITAIRLNPRVVGGDAGAVTASIMVCDDTEAPSAGVAAQSAAFDLKGAADTIQSATLSANVTVGAVDSISVDFTGVLTGAEGEMTIMVKRV